MNLASESPVRRRMADCPVTYLIFDLLYLDGRSLVDLPYAERRERLDALELEGPSWQTPSHHRGEGEALLGLTKERGLEGLVAKRLDSRYLPGRRSRAWLKVKNIRSQELVIGGWLPGQGRRAGTIGAILVGYHEDDDGGRRLRYAGRVGSGFTEAELRRLAGLLEPLETRQSPFDGPPASKAGRLRRARAWWPRSPSANGLRPEPCAPPCTRGCGPTRTRRRSSWNRRRRHPPPLRQEWAGEGLGQGGLRGAGDDRARGRHRGAPGGGRADRRRPGDPAALPRPHPHRAAVRRTRPAAVPGRTAATGLPGRPTSSPWPRSSASSMAPWRASGASRPRSSASRGDAKPLREVWIALRANMRAGPRLGDDRRPRRGPAAGAGPQDRQRPGGLTARHPDHRLAQAAASSLVLGSPFGSNTFARRGRT